jgi:hypothetical protein
MGAGDEAEMGCGPCSVERRPQRCQGLNWVSLTICRSDRGIAKAPSLPEAGFPSRYVRNLMERVSSRAALYRYIMLG